MQCQTKKNEKKKSMEKFWTYPGVPGNAGGVVLLDVALELREGTDPGLGPLDVALVLLLELLEDAICVERACVRHLLHIGAGGWGLSAKQQSKINSCLRGINILNETKHNRLSELDDWTYH